MADAIGSVCAALEPLRRLVEAHVMAPERLHGDDTIVPRAGAGEGPELHGPLLGLCPRRRALQRRRAARRDFPLFA